MEQTDCATVGNCPALAIAGDPFSTTSGSFTGYFDPSLAHDPDVANQVWLAYSWFDAVAGTSTSDAPVEIAVVQNHLARSTDGGATFTGIGALWPAIPLADPEGSGEMGIMASETASLASITAGGVTTWYGAHLRYFQQPIQGYNPKFATSWTVHVGSATSPAGLAQAPEAVLGVSSTAAVYKPDLALDTLAGLSLAQCPLLNNPTLFTQNGQLYLIVECVTAMGGVIDPANATIQVFATIPSGAAPSWSWRYVGKLADHSLATQLGSDTITQPDISLAQDGTPIMVISPMEVGPTYVGPQADLGCVAVELASIDPPALARDCAGRAIVRSAVYGQGYGACTHDSASATGILVGSRLSLSDPFTLRTSGVNP